MMRLNLEIGPLEDWILEIGGFLNAMLGFGILSYTFLRVGSMHEDLCIKIQAPGPGPRPTETEALVSGSSPGGSYVYSYGHL